MATEIIKVPDLGMDAATIIEISVKPGDVIAEDDTLIVLESDKASMDVPASKGGKITELKVKEGDSVSEGDEILYLEVEGAGDSQADDAPAEAESKSESASESKAEPEAAPASKGGGDVQEVKVPDIGMDSASIIEVHVKVGDTIAEEDTLVTLESDKASMDVPSEVAGEVVSVKIKEGDDISEGTVLIEVKTAGGGSKEAASSGESAPAAAPASSGGEKREVKVPDIGMDKASIIEVHVKEGDTIAEEDTLVTLESDKASMDVPSDSGIPSIPDQDYSKFGEVEIKELSRIQQITAANMWRNWVNIPHVTQFDEADVTDTEAFRNSLKPEMEKRGVKISPLAFIVKACAAALVEFPNFNVSLMADGQRYVQKHYVNIGVAVDTPNGLIVPVIKDADKKSIWQIAEEIIDFAKRGRDGKVKADEMKGGCFSVSSLGGLGGTAFTPIVNAPEVAILGISNQRCRRRQVHHLPDSGTGGRASTGALIER